MPMSEPSLADAVGAYVAEDEAGWDPRLERLAHGELSPAERAALERDAASDPELAPAVAAFTPPSEESLQELDRIAHRSLRGRRARVIPLFMTLPVAAAIALSLWPSPQALPPMTLTVQAGDRPLREATLEPQSLSLAGDSEIIISLRPEVTIEGALHTAVYATRGTRTWRVDAPVEVADTGAARLRARAEDLLGAAPGPGAVTLVVSRPGAGPSVAQLDAAGDGLRSGPGWQAARIQVVLRGSDALPDP
jgi:hypothetical protein